MTLGPNAWGHSYEHRFFAQPAPGVEGNGFRGAYDHGEVPAELLFHPCRSHLALGPGHPILLVPSMWVGELDVGASAAPDV
eukprot:713989-Lingulodinium_polyedra.AAC.1